MAQKNVREIHVKCCNTCGFLTYDGLDPSPFCRKATDEGGKYPFDIAGEDSFGIFTVVCDDYKKDT